VIKNVDCHPMADEIYHVLEGEGLFNDGQRETTLDAWPQR
jgi:mannose-6-phosphate isomerase-like protein (cupin superfamily)